jgi:hypothetical protein
MSIDAPTAKEFCRLLAGARQHQLEGWWEGVSRRQRPFGVLRNNFILCSEGHANDYGYADVILDPDAGVLPWCRNANVDGDPYPKPRSGGVLRVYNSGGWSPEEGPWRERLVETLADLRVELDAIEAADAARVEAAAQAERDAAEARLAAARAAMGRGPSSWYPRTQVPTWEDAGRRVELDLGLDVRTAGRLEVADAFRSGDREHLIFAISADDGRQFRLDGARRWRFLDEGPKDGGVK